MLAAGVGWLAFLGSPAGPTSDSAGAAAGVQGRWSSPYPLPGCAGGAAAAVAFPSASPSVPTGPGAVVWTGDRSCTASTTAPAGARLLLAVSRLGRGEELGPTATQPSPARSVGSMQAVGASLGRVAVAVPLRPAGLTVLQGRAGSSLRSALVVPDAGEPFSLAHAYLGDAAIAAVVPGPAIEVAVERYFSSGFGPPVRIPIRTGRVTALTATMDYRSDVLVAWQQEGAIYAHMLRASGRREPTQLVGSSQPDPDLEALVSDNDHGMLAWTSTTAGPAARTRVHVALSGAGVRFAGNRVVASFPDPDLAASLPGALALVRLETENVMLVWTELDGGHYVVRAVPAVFAATRPSTRLSDPAAQSVLVGVAPGPAGEAIALWRSAALPDRRSELWAARVTINSLVGSRAPERVAPSGLHLGPSIAVDPGSDRAVATWLAPGSRAHVELAAGPAAGSYRPPPASSAGTMRAAGTHWLRIALAALAATVAVAGLILLARRRRSVAGAGSSRRGTRRRR